MLLTNFCFVHYKKASTSIDAHLAEQTLTQALKAAAGSLGHSPMHAARLPPGQSGVGPGPGSPL